MRAFLLTRDKSSVGNARLAAVHLNLGEDFQAKEAATRALELDPKNPVAKSVLERVGSRELEQARSAQVKEGENGLTLDLGGEFGFGPSGQAPIVW